MKKLLLFLIFGFLMTHTLVAHPGIGIVMDEEGNVYYTDLVHVWKITPDGTQSIAVEAGHTHNLYLDANGDLYGEHEWYEGEETDRWGNYVWCLSKDGVFDKFIPDVEGFLDNTTLIRDSMGNSYWAKKVGETQVLMQESTAGIDHEFSTHKFNDIRWMHFSENDLHLYVVDHLSVKKVGSNGVVEIIAQNLKEDRFSLRNVADRHYVFGLWTDGAQNVFVALYGARKVKKINANGEVETVFESRGGWSPCGGLIDKDGNLWVMEFSRRNKACVRKVLPNGKDIVYEN
ncbi:MAG: hypothetical protein KTR22_08665 [Flavobacteriaceae bacterium]|nr:hypothetical protein [Flavobacteriaceae bacterium]